MTVAMSRNPGTHAVQFYDDQSYLYRSVAAFFAEPLRTGEPMVMVTRPSTFQGVVEHLASGIDAPLVDAMPRIVFVDAHEALAGFMDGLRPDPDRLDRNVSALLASLQAPPDATVWIYGEMSSVLCRSGNCAGADVLEDLWNKLFGHLRIELLCGYAMADFDDEVEATRFRAICGHHSHVRPAETFADAHDDRARLEQVAVLQQRVRVLDRPPQPTRAPEPDHETSPERALVYLIDDDVSVRRGLKRLLAAVRQPAQIFDSAEAFLAEVSPDAEGCVLVDIQLAGMSGIDLQRRMLSEQRRMPVIAMSGLHDPEIEAEAINLGATTFLRKPFDAQALLSAIERARASRQ